MISLTIGTNTTRQTVSVDPEQTLQEVLDTNNVNTTGCGLHLNGSLLAGVDTQETFTALGVADGGKAMLIAVVKADSAK